MATKLVEENKIQWDTLFFKLFPEFKNEKNLPYHQITLADLLSHRAKIQPFTSGYEFQQLPIFKGNTQERRIKFVQYVLTLPPAEYTEEFHYSNAGYSVAAAMLEKVSGKSWEDLVKQYLHTELGLKVIFGSPIRYAPKTTFWKSPKGYFLYNISEEYHIYTLFTFFSFFLYLGRLLW